MQTLGYKAKVAAERQPDENVATARHGSSNPSPTTSLSNLLVRAGIPVHIWIAIFE